jgi:hypothetical protein
MVLHVIRNGLKIGTEICVLAGWQRRHPVQCGAADRSKAHRDDGDAVSLQCAGTLDRSRRAPVLRALLAVAQDDHHTLVDAARDGTQVTVGLVEAVVDVRVP